MHTTESDEFRVRNRQPARGKVHGCNAKRSWHVCTDSSHLRPSIFSSTERQRDEHGRGGQSTSSSRREFLGINCRRPPVNLGSANFLICSPSVWTMARKADPRRASACACRARC